MKSTPATFGLPDTLPALGPREFRGCLMFAAMGLFVLLLGLFPGLRPPPGSALPLLILWLALPAWGLFKFLKRKPRASVEKRESGTRTQVGMYAVVMIGAGIGYFLWAKRLGVAPPVVIGTLLILEGLGGMIVSFTE